jgi:hypothetical protein
MDVRYFAMAKLIFLVMWTTVCGPLSGFTMGLFFLVYHNGFFGDVPSFAVLTSRFSSGHR